MWAMTLWEVAGFVTMVLAMLAVWPFPLIPLAVISAVCFVMSDRAMNRYLS